MKFGKEFVSQMVPEWQEAYMNYNFLKGLLKDVLRFRQQNMLTAAMSATPRSSLKRRVSLYRAFSGLTGRYRGSPRKNNEDEAILVSAVEEEGSEGHYQTMFLMSSEAGGEYELVYFRRLDEEFNKVVKFYKGKVEEVMREAEELNKQMDALIALRIKVENPPVGNCLLRFSFQSEIYRNPNSLSAEECWDIEMSSGANGANSEDERGRRNMAKSSKGREGKPDIEGFKPASLDILNHVKINIERETPISTLKGILTTSTSDLSFSKEELRKAEELITKAFVEFHKKLRVLKSYCFLNQLAFSKIMKKYDKITSRNASKAYLEMVDNSPIGSSDEARHIS
ncbi:unnamed protein product, partial [Vitis vinifera]